MLGPIPAPAGTPQTYKFGFSGSTGGSTDVHLLRNVVVGTVKALDALSVEKQVDRTTALPPVLTAGSGHPVPVRRHQRRCQTLHGVSDHRHQARHRAELPARRRAARARGRQHRGLHGALHR